MRRDILPAFVLLASCVVPKPVPDDDGGTCAEAAANITRLRCEGWRGSPGYDETFGTEDDVPLQVVCEQTEALGADWHTACAASAKTCEEVGECFF